MSIPSQNKNSDKRAAKRVNLDKHIIIQVNQQPLQARILNISVSGIGILCHTDLPPNTIIHANVELSLHNHTTTLKLDGKVVHSTAVHDQYLVGIALCDLTAYRQAIIEQFVATND